MSEKYKEYCMKFSNEEIRAYMVDYLISNSMNNKLIKYLSEDGDEIQFNTSEKIGTIVFDGDDENLFINFYGIHTSIFVDDTEIMFIDENSKGTYTSSDVQLDVPENAYKKYNYYEPHRFIIEVKNSNEIQKESIYENITIKH